MQASETTRPVCKQCLFSDFGSRTRAVFQTCNTARCSCTCLNFGSCVRVCVCALWQPQHEKVGTGRERLEVAERQLMEAKPEPPVYSEMLQDIADRFTAVPESAVDLETEIAHQHARQQELLPDMLQIVYMTGLARDWRASKAAKTVGCPVVKHKRLCFHDVFLTHLRLLAPQSTDLHAGSSLRLDIIQYKIAEQLLAFLHLAAAEAGRAEAFPLQGLGNQCWIARTSNRIAVLLEQSPDALENRMDR